MSELPGLPPLEAPRVEAPVVPAAEVTRDTLMSQAEGIHAAAGALEGPVTDEWLNNSVELGVRSSVKKLLDAGVQTFTSGANKDNVGSHSDVAPAHIGIKLDQSERSAHLVQRAQQMHEAAARSGMQPEELGFAFDVVNDPDAPEWNGLYIKVATTETDTVGQVSDKFDLLTEYLLSSHPNNELLEPVSEAQETKEDPFAKPPKVQNWAPPRVQNWAPPNPEAVVKLDIHKYVEQLTSDQTLNNEAQQLRNTLVSDPEMAHLVDLATQLDNVIKQFNDTSDYDEAFALNDKIKDIQKAMSSNWELKARYNNIMNSLARLEQKSAKRKYISLESEQAQQLFSLVFEPSNFAVHGTQLDDAPMKGSADNTKEAWQYVPDQEIKGFLQGRFFMDTDYVGLDKNAITIESGRTEGVDVPLDVFVSAERFDSWQGRNGATKVRYSEEYGEDRGSSLDAIKHYAALPTEVPPVSSMIVYVQPNGKVFADNESGDSHRIAAAMLKGQKTIKVNNITIKPIDRNYI